MSDQALDPHALRRALGNFATGITIVTAQSPDGDRIGLTVNSFNSVSLEPPLVLWSLDKRSVDSLDVIHRANHFAINILAADQIDLSNHFARPQADKFAGISYREGPGRAPLLEGCAARFHCTLHETVDAGDHWILIGRVVDFDDIGRAPLLYHQGAYSLVLPHPRLQAPDGHTESPPLEAGLSDNVLYLMLQAVNAYQSAYLPKQQSLGLSISEARVLILLSALKQGPIEQLQRESSLPGSEVREALDNLEQAGLVLATGQRSYHLTPLGQERARQYWALSEQEQQQVLEQFDDAQIELFKQILNSIIRRA